MIVNFNPAVDKNICNLDAYDHWQLLLLVHVGHILIHADGVSLKLRGVTIPNNSLVDVDDVLYSVPSDPHPNNANGLHNQTLLCETYLIDCCDSPKTARGDWYYPDGRAVQFEGNRYNVAFWRNRGQNEVINGSQFYGSVRLWRIYSPGERGRFHCELPDANNVTQTLYANIGKNNSITISMAFELHAHHDHACMQ